MNRCLLQMVVLVCLAGPLRAVPVETRACELRIENNWTVQGVKDAVDRLAYMGFNCVRVETFYHGSTIYNSAVMTKWGLPPLRGAFTPGTAALPTVILTAHSHGMTVYAWVESFYVWNTTLGSGYGPILNKYPQWSIRNADGTMLPKQAETSYYFMSPANLQARQFLKDLYAEIANTGVDGLFVDYLRYPRQALGPTDGLSFDDASKQRAQAELGLDITTIPLDLSNADFKAWTLWRQQQTTDSAREEALAVRAANPSVVFVSSIHPGQASDWKAHDSLRDWTAWWPEVAAFSMQYYTSGSPPTSNDIQSQESAMDLDLTSANSAAILWPGIRENDILSGAPLLNYIRTQPYLGVSYWVYSAMSDLDGISLKAGPFKIASENAETAPIRSARTLTQGVLSSLPVAWQTGAQRAIGDLSGALMHAEAAQSELQTILAATDISASARRDLGLAYRLLSLAPATLALGDANRDGAVTIDDAVAIERWLNAGPAICRDAADMNSDGRVTGSDVTPILRLAAGL